MQSIARWESPRGKHFVELQRSEITQGPYAGIHYGYRGNGCGGGLVATNEAEAFAELQGKIDKGYFLPDKAKQPMKRVAKQNGGLAPILSLTSA